VTAIPVPDVTLTPAAPTPSVVPSTPAARDRTRCRVTARTVTGQSIKTVRKSGLRLRVTTDERCRIELSASVDRRTARRLGVDHRARGSVVVARGTSTLPVGSRTVTIKLTRKARAALARTRGVSLSLRATTRDGSGNRGVVPARKVALRR
jgi:hypothetical protein